MKTGDIVLIPFPFSELTQIKIRPAVVVAETKDKYKDLILAKVVSSLRLQTANKKSKEPGYCRALPLCANKV